MATQFVYFPKIPAPAGSSIGQKNMANSAPVVIASDQSAVAVSAASLPLPAGASTAAKQPALGTAGAASADVLTVQGIASMTALKVDGSAVTQPVSAASLPLPTGAATAAKQPALGTAGTASSDVLTVQGIASMTALKVDGSAVTQPVSGTVTANQGGTWSTRALDGSGNAITSAVVGSNRGLHVEKLGYAAQNHARNDYTVTNVLTSAYVQLVASTAGEVQNIEIFDSSGQTLVLATGAAGSEVDQIYVLPGGNGRVPLRIAAATRVSIKAVSATANAGEIDINFYG